MTLIAMESSTDSQPQSRSGRSAWEALSGLCASGLYLALSQAGIHEVVLNGAQRGTLYSAVLVVGIGWLAFGLTPATILLTLAPGDRLKAVLKHHDEQLRRVILRSLWSILAVVVVGMAALGLDQNDPGSRWIRYVLLAVSVAALVCICRLIVVFGEMMRTITKDKMAQPAPSLPEVPRRRRGAG